MVQDPVRVTHSCQPGLASQSLQNLQITRIETNGKSRAAEAVGFAAFAWQLLFRDVHLGQLMAMSLGDIGRNIYLPSGHWEEQSLPSTG